MLRKLLVALLVGVFGVAASVVPAQATLVDPQWVVTAASCFGEGDAGTVTPGVPV